MIEEKSPLIVHCGADSCGHEWAAAYLPMEVTALTSVLSGARCPLCAGKKVLMGKNPVEISMGYKVEKVSEDVKSSEVEPDEEGFIKRYNDDKVDLMNDEEWENWVNALPWPEALAMLLIPSDNSKGFAQALGG